MAGRTTLSEIRSAVAPALVTWREGKDASFINLPILYPSGSFVTVRLTYVDSASIRVSDSGFAYREAESFGATRSFPRTARSVGESFDVSVGKRVIFVDVPPTDVERAIFDVSAASREVAERIVSNVAFQDEAEISDVVHTKLDRIFPGVRHDGKVVGASSIEWDVTAVATVDSHLAIFQAVSNYPIAVYKASTAFHDLAALDQPPVLVSVVPSKAEMGKNYSILAQVGRVVEVGQPDDAFFRAAA